MNKKVGVIIGRFQPVHKFHIEHLLKPALAECNQALVLLGSSFSARNIKNPFNWGERGFMLQKALAEAGLDPDKVLCEPIRDYPYNDTRWQMQIQKAVSEYLEDFCIKDAEIILYGVDKDETTWYLQMFPQWETRVLDRSHVNVVASATDVRKAIFEEDWDTVKTLTGDRVFGFIFSWYKANPEAKRLQNEYEFIQRYKKQFESMPYPPVFQTVDNIVLWRGHILLVERGAQPGKGLWALPGGFIKNTEWIVDAAVRELEEETSIRFFPFGSDRTKKLRPHKSWIRASRTFDHPDRSLRGRTITIAYLWRIPDHYEIEIKAADDAAKARWFPISIVLNNMNYQLYEDHQAIIAEMVLRETDR